jgi:hypothetical protein
LKVWRMRKRSMTLMTKRRRLHDKKNGLAHG